MRLEGISSPYDLRGRSYEELADLCSQIRTKIINTVTTQGGHLGSNLGAVELTIALHRVFRSPHDVILWDTGHQAYVHKMLTGRLNDFHTLRQQGGLSGYPSRSESAHDWIENSHASTSLAYAHGLATAFEAQDSRRHVVAVIGDGAMTGGMAFEGINNLGHSGSKVVAVLNDNGRSYAPTVSRLSESLIKIRSNPVYMRRQARLEKIAESIPWVGETIHQKIQQGVRASKAVIREFWEPSAFFENLDVRYIGPFDGHDIASLEEAFKNAAGFDVPVVVHVLTQKGRGYKPAEDDHIKHMHDSGSIKPGSYTAVFSDTLLKLGAEHPELVVITAAMPDSTGVLPFRAQFGKRCIDVGIAEQHAVTAATGMAIGGLRPVVAVYSTFLTRAFDQTNLDCGLHKAPVLFCLDRAGITGDDGPSHHGVLDMVLLTKVPGMTVMAPSSVQELVQMMHHAMSIKDGPVAIRWPKTAARNVDKDQVGSGLKARLVSCLVHRHSERSGLVSERSADSESDNSRDDSESDNRLSVCLIGVGKMLEACEQAAQTLAADCVDVTVWDPRIVKPLCQEMLKDAAKHSLVVTVEDGIREGGFGAAVRDAIYDINIETDHAQRHTMTRCDTTQQHTATQHSSTLHDTAAHTPKRTYVKVLGVPVSYIPHGKPASILAELGLDAKGITNTVQTLINKIAV